jgi:hypothetical protein
MKEDGQGKRRGNGKTQRDVKTIAVDRIRWKLFTLHMEQQELTNIRIHIA